MPVLPRPERLSLHDAINYVAERCKCDAERAGKAVYAALGEGALRLDAHLLIRESRTRPLVDAGIGAVPSLVWVNYPWPDFQRRAVLPRGNPQYREWAAGGNWVGPIYGDPTVATSAIDTWLDGSPDMPASAPEDQKGRGSKLSPDDIITEIENYEKQIAVILSGFRGHDIRSAAMTETAAEIYPQLIMEVIDLFHDALGPNQYSTNILRQFNLGLSSRKSVQDILALIRAAHTRIERNPEILKKKLEAPDEEPMVQQVFIGHGHSPVWRELQDFLQNRLKLSVEEFNSVAVAGIPTATRLEEMLGAATFAFLVMTAEDETPDGKFRARMNVVHEAGLFQGKLGFRKAIVLLENGCEDFSNIHGLGQIRFSKGNLTAKFEEIRQVLEREHIISP
jgi:predicted nucleotide-binding protein